MYCIYIHTYNTIININSNYNICIKNYIWLDIINYKYIIYNLYQLHKKILIQRKICIDVSNLNAGLFIRGLRQRGGTGASLGGSGLTVGEAELSGAWDTRSRAFELIFSSATSWSKFLLLPCTFLRWWMEWIWRRDDVLVFDRRLAAHFQLILFIKRMLNDECKCFHHALWFLIWYNSRHWKAFKGLCSFNK